MIFKVKYLKFLSILLTSAMLLSLFSATAYAAAPVISNAVMDPGNVRIHVTFSEGIYSDMEHSAPVTVDDFTFVFEQNGGALSNATLSSIRTISNGNPVGGETSLFFYLNLTGGPASGEETITIAPAGAAAIYNGAGEAMASQATTGPIQLYDKKVEFVSTYPVAGAPQAAGSKQVELIVKPLNETVTAYVVAVADGAAAPNDTQVMTGKGSDNNAALTAASLAAEPAGDTSIMMTLPADATDYDSYVVLKDIAGNNTNPVKVDVRTPEAALVSDVCRIGTTGYATLDMALDTVVNNTPTTITLLEDITDNDGIIIARKNITLDLNGNNLTINNSSDRGLCIELLSEVSVIGTGNLNIHSRMVGLSVNESKFIASEQTSVSIISDNNVGVYTDTSCTVLVNGNVTGAIGVYASYNNTITISGTVTATGSLDHHAVLLNNTGNKVSVGSAIVASGYGAGVYTGDSGGGEVTVGTQSTPGRIVGRGHGIWTRMGIEPVSITVYGDVEGASHGIFASDDSTITIHGNVKSTSSLRDRYGVYGFLNSDPSNIVVDGDVEGVNGVYIHGADSEVTVKGNVTAYGNVIDENFGVRASYAKLYIEGNITANSCTGAYSAEASEITVDGTISAVNYITVKYNDKTIMDKDATSTKVGYLQYSSSDAFVWVKEVDTAKTYTIAPIMDQTMTVLNSSYESGTQQTKLITIASTGSEELTNLAVSLSGAAADSFELTQPVITVLNTATPNTTFTIRAKDGLEAGTYTVSITVTADNMLPVIFQVIQKVIALPIIDATISPVSVTFDKNPSLQADVSITITWNDATNVTDIKKLDTSIGINSYSVNGNTLLIKKQYLVTQVNGNVVLTVELDKGNAVALSIEIKDTTPAVIPGPGPIIIPPMTPTATPTPTPMVEMIDIDRIDSSATAKLIKTDNNRSVNVTISLPTSQILEQSEKEGSEEEPLILSIPVTSELLKAILKEKEVQTATISITIPDTIQTNNRLITNLLLDKELLELAKKNVTDLTVSVTDESGRERYSWSFTGNNLVASKHEFKDTYLSIEVEALSSHAKIKELVYEGNQEDEGVILGFGHEGVLPAQASVRIYVGDQKGIKPGDSIHLYHYNESTGKLETLPYSSSYRVDKDGYVNISLLHCSVYVLLPKQAASKIITSLRAQINILPLEKTLYLGQSLGETTKIQVALPVTLELVDNPKDKTLGSAIGAVTVSYKSSNDSVATVSSEGIVRAISVGTARITTKVTLYSGKVKTVVTLITVQEPFLSFSKSIASMKEGESFVFEVKAYGLKSDTVTWTTTKKSIIIIDKKTGKATAKSKGVDYVVAKVGDVIKKLKVTVK